MGTAAEKKIDAGEVSTVLALANFERSIPERFGEVALTYPNRVAVSGAAGSWTYAMLDAKANAIARSVLARLSPGNATTRSGKSEIQVSVPGQKTVALLMARDAPLFAAMLGVMKAGHIYVALDPTHPTARAGKIIEGAGPALIVTDEENVAAAMTLAGTARPVLNVDRVGLESEPPRLVRADPSAFAYIVYTSGSTGAPKGVVQNHRNVLHNAAHHSRSLGISASDRLTLLASCGTAQAMTDVYSALLTGAALCPFDVRAEGFETLARWLANQQITIYHSSASIYRGLVDTLGNDERFPQLRVVKLGSEQVFTKDVGSWQRHFASTAVLVNALSSSEAMTFRQVIVTPQSVSPQGTVAVGYAVDGKDVQLIDENGAHVAVGEPGEIVIRSRYLSPGYWGRSDLTRASFNQDPDDPLSRHFRTGDMGRMAGDGCLEYLGRKDDQVKIRGFRVEVAEVEAAILVAGPVRQAVVMVQKSPSDTVSLVAYIVPAAGSELSDDEMRSSLRAALRERLPEHMVPTRWVVLDQLPLGPSGKVDRASLPPSASAAAYSGDTYVPPRSPLESQIVHIWQELLSVPEVGVRDDFFELGGHSLLAVRMVDRIEQISGRRLPLATLYTSATVEHMASVLLRVESDQFKCPLVEIQRGGSRVPLFFLHGDYNGGGFYCRNLARHLGPEQPVYALLPHGLDGGEIPDTIEAMAADRLRVLLDFCPRGPYVLAGYCNGGLVAFEMARQLEQSGQVVDRVVVIDAVANVTRLDRVDRALGDSLRRLRGFVGEVGRRSAAGVGAQARYVGRRLSDAARVGTITRPPHSGRESNDAVTVPPADSSDVGRVYGARNRVYRAVMMRYVCRPFHGRVVVLRSRTMRWRSPFDATAGWSRVAGEVEVHRLAGGHLSCLTEHVGTLAEHLRAVLSESG